jgi:hypothetical protein
MATGRGRLGYDAGDRLLGQQQSAARSERTAGEWSPPVQKNWDTSGQDPEAGVRPLAVGAAARVRRTPTCIMSPWGTVERCLQRGAEMHGQDRVLFLCKKRRRLGRDHGDGPFKSDHPGHGYGPTGTGCPARPFNEMASLSRMMSYNQYTETQSQHVFASGCD